MTLTVEQGAWAFCNSAVKKHNAPIPARLVKAFFAGMFLSFGGMLALIVGGGSPTLTMENPGLVKIASAAVFPVGLVMIVLLQQELLTSNMMTFMMSSIKKKTPIWGLLLDWTIIFIGNLAGSLFVAGLLVHFSDIYTGPITTYSATFARMKVVTPNFRDIFLRGIGCNVLVCIAVFQATMASEIYSKILAAWFPIFVFVAAGFDHVIANMFFVPVGLMSHQAHFGVGLYIWKSLIASFLGNVVGAAILAIPFSFIYLKDIFDPESPEQLPYANQTHLAKSSESPNGTIGEVRAVPNANEKTTEWERDIERAAQVP